MVFQGDGSERVKQFCKGDSIDNPELLLKGTVQRDHSLLQVKNDG
jgi:hypothetical protein